MPQLVATLRFLWNLPNEAIGRAFGLFATGCGGASLRWEESGRIAVYEGIGGPVGRFIRAINGGRDAAMTIGSVVLNTSRFDTAERGRWWFAHERAHVGQSQVLGPLYLPLYLLGLIPAGLWALVKHNARLVHDAHPLEVLANRSAAKASGRC